ncbi:putative nuclease HARBI1 [Anopheles gambiae]|uniref:DDE Tnp4 domain-containing protein n=2 Tax=Anopheles coluzzii TaxID=1518534 RepID=A0A9I3BD94_ANOCL|nr:putative nuclease HARBI1 isoform X2 [Anopheles coluzzii]XP_061514113.1 putative nuclease HARBI1 [Anopheles gambiae]
MDSDSDSEVMLSTNFSLRYILLRKRRNKTNDLWKHRKRNGQYYVLFPELLKQEDKFFQYMRMSKKTFYFILRKIEPFIAKLPTHTPYISPEERLMVTLRFLSTGLPFKSLSFTFCIAHNTIGTIVYETCEAIWKTLNEEFIPFPTTSAFNKVEREFLNKWKFPNCIGAIDGKHVRVKAPSKSGTQYFNYKKYFSLHLQAVADANSKFIAVDVGEYGSRCDSGVFKSSTLYQLIQSNRLNIPPPKPLPGTRQDVPHVLIGDQGYPLKTFLLRPYPDSEDPAKLHFNELLSIARRCVECAFGILVAKWRCLKTELQVTPEHVTLIVQTTCLLHNICMEFKEPLPNPAKNTRASDINYNRANNHSSHQATDLRDYFKNYFFHHID